MQQWQADPTPNMTADGGRYQKPTTDQTHNQNNTECGQQNDETTADGIFDVWKLSSPPTSYQLD